MYLLNKWIVITTLDRLSRESTGKYDAALNLGCGSQDRFLRGVSGSDCAGWGRDVGKERMPSRSLLLHLPFWVASEARNMLHEHHITIRMIYNALLHTSPPLMAVKMSLLVTPIVCSCYSKIPLPYLKIHGRKLIVKKQFDSLEIRSLVQWQRSLVQRQRSQCSSGTKVCSWGTKVTTSGTFNSLSK